GGAGDDTIQGSYLQLVYLDFDSASGPNEHVYTVAERDLIQARLEQDFPAPLSVSFTQTAPAVARFNTIIFNAGAVADNEAIVGGQASEIDWRQVDAAPVADINVNGFLGHRAQPPASGDNFVALTAEVAAHELGHLFGL